MKLHCCNCWTGHALVFTLPPVVHFIFSSHVNNKQDVLMS